MAKQQGATPKKSPDGTSLFAAVLVGVLLTLAIGLFIYLWNPFNQGKVDLTTHTADGDASDKPMIQPINASGVASQPSDYEFYDLLKQQQVSGVPDQTIASQPTPANPQPDVVVTGKAEPTDTTAAPDEQTGDTATNDPTADNPSTASPKPTTDKPKSAKAPKIDGTSTADVTVNEPATADNRVNISDVEPSRTFILQINSFDNADEADRRRAEVLMAGVDAQIVKRRLADDSMAYQVISRPMTSPQMAAQAQRRLQNSGIDSLIVEQRRK